VLLYEFIVAVLNLCVGYALAVYLAPRLGLAWAAPAVPTKSREPSIRVAPAADPSPEADVPLAPASAPPAPLSPVVEPTPEIPPEWLELLDETERGNSFVEASIHVLKLEVGRYRDELIRIDARVRQCLATPDPAVIDECLVELKRCNVDWLARQEEAAVHLRDRKGNLGEFSSMGASLEETLLEQTAQIETTCSNIEQLDFGGDPAAGCQRLIGEAGRLLDMAHNLRDRMHESLLAIVLHEKRIETFDKRLQVDSLTGVYNRSGIEAVFYEWWRDDPGRIRLASVAMLDLDRFGRVNELYGAIVGDRLLRGFAQLLQDLVRKDRGFDVIGRLSGQRFVVFFGDTGPRAATSAIERIRQTICATSFEHGDAEIQMTVSCGVTEVTVIDSTMALFERLRKTMREAKKAGRNGSCLDEGTGPAAVEPPTFEVKGRIVRLSD
jgi:diguanylate cyclase